jgi:hypothetical protein
MNDKDFMGLQLGLEGEGGGGADSSRHCTSVNVERTARRILQAGWMQQAPSPLTFFVVASRSSGRFDTTTRLA